MDASNPPPPALPSADVNTEKVARRQRPPMPPMRVVTKGWWVMREEKVPLEELKRRNLRDK